MLEKKLVLLLSALLILALTACNLPAGLSPEVSSLALTITAQARLLEPGANPQQQEPQQPPPAEPQATATLEFTPTLGPSSTPTVPQVTVTTNTNCRTGPGTAYDLIDALLVGQTGEVVGKSSGAPNYWIIKRINGSGTCWLWGQYATVTGNTANLPEYPVPPTPTPIATVPPPFAVTSVSFTNSGGCGGVGFTATVNITTNGAGTVNWHWIRNDGATPPVPPQMVFAAAGTQSASISWLTTASGTHYFDIIVDSPNNQQFGRAEFICP